MALQWQDFQNGDSGLIVRNKLNSFNNDVVTETDELRNLTTQRDQDVANLEDRVDINEIDIADIYNDLSERYKKSDFVDLTDGAQDGGKPVKLNSNGYIDESLIEATPVYVVGSWDPSLCTDPSTGCEYPETTGEDAGAFWFIDEITTPNDGFDYIFQEGDLATKSISVGDYMIWGSAGWSIMQHNSMDPDVYYKLDGTSAITGPFAGGGQEIINIVDGTADNSGATVKQVNDVQSQLDNKEDLLGLGMSGQVLATNQAADGKEWVDMSSGGGGGFKNRIINSGFQVWQDTNTQGTKDVTGHGGDLFYTGFTNYTTGKATYSKDTIGQDTALKLTIDEASSGADTDRWFDSFAYDGESIDIYDLLGENITISFKFVSNVTGTFPVTLFVGDSSIQVAAYVATFDYTTAGAVQDVSVTITVPTNAELTYDVTNTPGDWGFEIGIGTHGGTTYQAPAKDTWYYNNNWYTHTSDCTDWTTSVDNYIKVANLQLEKGSVATDYEKVDYATELNRVQRYYKKVDISAWLSGGIALGGGSGEARSTSAIDVTNMQYSPTLSGSILGSLYGIDDATTISDVDITLIKRGDMIEYYADITEAINAKSYHLQFIEDGKYELDARTF